MFEILAELHGSVNIMSLQVTPILVSTVYQQYPHGGRTSLLRPNITNNTKRRLLTFIVR